MKRLPSEDTPINFSNFHPAPGRRPDCLGAGDANQAIIHYTQALALHPSFAMAYSNRGAAFQKQANLESAIADYNESIAADPDYATAYSNRGFAYYKKGGFNQAISDCSKAISLRPDFANAYSNRAMSYAAIGDRELATLDFRRALDLTRDPVVEREAKDGLKALGIEL